MMPDDALTLRLLAEHVNLSVTAFVEQPGSVQ